MRLLVEVASSYLRDLGFEFLYVLEVRVKVGFLIKLKDGFSGLFFDFYVYRGLMFFFGRRYWEWSL